jgi:hypothetical protein
MGNTIGQLEEELLDLPSRYAHSILNTLSATDTETGKVALEIAASMLKHRYRCEAALSIDRLCEVGVPLHVFQRASGREESGTS